MTFIYHYEHGIQILHIIRVYVLDLILVSNMNQFYIPPNLSF